MNHLMALAMTLSHILYAGILNYLVSHRGSVNSIKRVRTRVVFRTVFLCYYMCYMLCLYDLRVLLCRLRVYLILHCHDANVGCLNFDLGGCVCGIQPSHHALLCVLLLHLRHRDKIVKIQFLSLLLGLVHGCFPNVGPHPMCYFIPVGLDYLVLSDDPFPLLDVSNLQPQILL